MHIWLCCVCMYAADDYAAQLKAPANQRFSQELQSVLSFANVPLSQSAAFNCNGSLLNGESSAGYTSAGYTSVGYTSVGYTSVGYTSVGYTSAGYTSAGYTSAGYTSAGYTSTADAVHQVYSGNLTGRFHAVVPVFMNI